MTDRIERDALGTVTLPADALYGVHTARALMNFPISRRPVPRSLIHAFGEVKRAALETNGSISALPLSDEELEALARACRELAAGDLDDHMVVDGMQGGAGTSTNMNANEVIANRALQLLGDAAGNYGRISPLDHVNKHQSTNDTYPTALRLAAIWEVQKLEQAVVALQERFQEKEKEFAHLVKVGRTQLQDAVLTTVGRQMGAYADVLSRDRWRLYKCVERLRVVNLGGTAIGTGLGAPRKYIFRVVDVLRANTGIGFARAENLVDATQNADVFVEVSGIIKALAVTLMKIAGDLRLQSSGPEAGLAELRLPPAQAGSSIMPGKVNPVVPEAVSQVAMQVIGNDTTIAMAVAGGSLELNPFLPLVARNLLDSLEMLRGACDVFAGRCVNGIQANESRLRDSVDGATTTVTALVEALGYDLASRLQKTAREEGRTVRDVVVGDGHLTEVQYLELTSPEAVCRLGSKS